MYSRLLIAARRHRRAVRVVAATTALAVAASVAQVVDFPQWQDPDQGRPSVQRDGRPAPARPAPDAQPRGTDHAKTLAVKQPPAVSWPTPATATVKLRGGAGAEAARTKVGGLPVAVAPAPQVPADPASPAAGANGPAGAAETPGSVRVQTFDRSASQRAGVDGPLLRVGRADGDRDRAAVRLDIDYSGVENAFGGDFGSRLRLVRLPECALRTPQAFECRPQQLPARNDTATNTLSATVTLAAAGTLLAAAAEESSSQGSYGATELSPSSSWSVSPSSGGFSWSYPLRVVPVPGGRAPGVTLGYSSQAVDGRTATTNNQGSWLGEGFSYEPGYVERQYKPCQDDGHEDSGDLCWSHDNALLMLNGRSSQLVRSGDTWRFASDDGTRVQRLTGAANGDDDGEHWKVTTTDGTQYFFGLNRLPGWTGAAGQEETRSTWTVPVFGDDAGEPCHQSTFEAGHCQQGWRWNLDYVRDLHSNVMSYFYEPETNAYALGRRTDVPGATYTRGGWLRRIDYGQREGAVYTTPAPARVVFDTAERCIPTAGMACRPEDLTAATANAWPDVPFDRACTPGSACKDDQASPTFWTRKRVTAIHTQIRSGADWSPVDTWRLEHFFTDNADGSRTLWLHAITHQGRVGVDDPESMPSVTLDSEQHENRIRRPNDGIGDLIRPRLSVVHTDAGGRIDVRYAPQDCAAGALPTPGASTNRCFPVIWHPGGAKDPVTDWFHKYVVVTVVETDATTVQAGTVQALDMVTSYEYVGDAAWRHPAPDGISDPEYVSWSEWRGYEQVRVRQGDGTHQTTLTEHTYLRGMHGDQQPGGGTRSVTRSDSEGGSYVDEDELAGFEIETATWDGATKISKTITEPWRYETASQTWTWGTDRAFFVLPQTVRGFTALESGGWRETRTTTTYDPKTDTYPDPVGRVTQVEDFGDVTDPDDDTCTRTRYADNPAIGLRSLVAEAETVAVGCQATPDRATQVLSHGRTHYDGLAFGAAPTRGDPTRTEKLAGHDGTTASYVMVAEGTFDGYGRPLTTTDASGQTTTTSYVETDGLTTKKTETTPKVTVSGVATAFTATTEYAPAWGQPTAQVDWNGKRTDLAYDAFGRLTSVWLPNRYQSMGQSPSIRYGYQLDGVHPTAVKTEKIKIDGTYAPEFQIYDGFLRPRQTQAPGPDGGRLVADTFYTATGKIALSNDTYYAEGAASGELLPVVNGDVDLQTAYVYDGADRATDTITRVAGVEQWRTTTRYGGDRTHTDPPEGATPTTSITDVKGHLVELRQYHGDGPTGEADVTRYTYTAAGQLATVTDPSGIVWRYGYDQRGRKTWAEDPDAGRSTFGYDDMDRRTWARDARGVLVSSEYDQLGRVTGTYQGEGDTRSQLAGWTYDVRQKGQVFAASRYVDQEAYTVYTQSLDDFYRPLRTTYRIPAGAGAGLAKSYTFDTTYNYDGTVQATGLPAAGDLPLEVITYTYDDLQRLTSIKGYASGFVYGQTGELKRVTLGAGGKAAWVTNSYAEGTKRLQESVLARQSTAEVPRPTSDVDQHYGYDDAGNVLSIADTPGTGERDIQCFTYDHLRRMTEAWSTANQAEDPCAGGPAAGGIGGPAPYHQSYTFDASGNRRTEHSYVAGAATGGEVSRTYTYPQATEARPHALDSVTETTAAGDRLSTFGYDEAGNTTRRSVIGQDQDLTWDAEGHLATSTTGGATTSFVYSADGERLLRREPGATTLYLPGTELRLNTATGQVAATRFYDVAGQALVVRTASGVQFQISDHHGTGQAAVDAATGELAYRRSTPFGTPRGAQPAEGVWQGEKGFVGGTMDATTGLTHLGAREYDPEHGRFVSVDPVLDVTDPQQMNAYGYANNSPVSFSDPSGEKFCSDDSCGHGADWVDLGGKYHDAPGHNDGCGGCSGAVDPTVKPKKPNDTDKTKEVVIAVAKELGKILMDELGITDALDCFTTGDLGACAATALTVISSLIGGIAGKLVAKYAFRLPKLAKLVKRIKDLGTKLYEAVSGWMRARKAARALHGAENAADMAGDLCNSFLPGTLVLLADGSTKPIEDLQVGDTVQATDPDTGVSEAKPVIATIIGRGDKHLVQITVDTDGPAGQAEGVVVATDGHPFWVADLQAWVKATDLQVGQWLQTASGTWVQVTAVARWTEHAEVRNLTVDDIHTYHVMAGTTPVLVHNCDGIVVRV